MSQCVSRNTNIVIEGFPRSANTFALHAFQDAQNHHVKVAHHLHSSVQLELAVKWKIPALLLIREPKLAISSFLVRCPFYSPRQLVKMYIRFHQDLLPFRSSLVVADFNEATKQMDRVISRVNEKFGTHFAEFHHDRASVDRVFSLIDQQHNKEGVGSRAKERMACRPTAARDQLKKETLDRLNQKDLKPLFQKADELYKLFLGEAGAKETTP